MKYRVTRIVSRAFVCVLGVKYHAEALIGYHKKAVLVEFDDEDAAQVNVYTLKGKKLICTAEKLKTNPFKGE